MSISIDTVNTLWKAEMDKLLHCALVHTVGKHLKFKFSKKLTSYNITTYLVT